jgi:hypothetical protein
MKRKNTRRFDPRYFMDEKTEKPKVIKEGLTDSIRDEQGRLYDASKQGPGIPSEPTNPRELTPREKLADLQHQLKTAYYNPAAGPAIQQQIDALLDEHPELRDRGEGPMAEGHGDAGMYQLGPAQMLDSALVLLDNEPDARDIEDAIAILVKLQAHIS